MLSEYNPRMKRKAPIFLSAILLITLVYLGGGVPGLGGPNVSSGFKTDAQTHAISGNRIVIQGHHMVFEGLECPDPQTEAGRDAKALMNTYLRTNIYCRMTSWDSAMWVGSCEANGKSVAAGMKQTGLCK